MYLHILTRLVIVKDTTKFACSTHKVGIASIFMTTSRPPFVPSVYIHHLCISIHHQARFWAKYMDSCGFGRCSFQVLCKTSKMKHPPFHSTFDAYVPRPPSPPCPSTNPLDIYDAPWTRLLCKWQSYYDNIA